MIPKDFEHWLEGYKSAWENRDPQAAADLFSTDAQYYETPFTEPFIGRAQIFNYWADVPRHQTNINFSYQILAVAEDSGIARWRADFQRLPSRKPVALDGVLQATFDENGLCQLFEEWWHRLEGS